MNPDHILYQFNVFRRQTGRIQKSISLHNHNIYNTKSIQGTFNQDMLLIEPIQQLRNNISKYKQQGEDINHLKLNKYVKQY